MVANHSNLKNKLLELSYSKNRANFEAFWYVILSSMDLQFKKSTLILPLNCAFLVKVLTSIMPSADMIFDEDKCEICREKKSRLRLAPGPLLLLQSSYLTLKMI